MSTHENYRPALQRRKYLSSQYSHLHLLFGKGIGMLIECRKEGGKLLASVVERMDGVL